MAVYIIRERRKGVGGGEAENMDMGKTVGLEHGRLISCKSLPFVKLGEAGHIEAFGASHRKKMEMSQTERNDLV